MHGQAVANGIWKTLEKSRRKQGVRLRTSRNGHQTGDIVALLRQAGALREL